VLQIDCAQAAKDENLDGKYQLHAGDQRLSADFLEFLGKMVVFHNPH
jgi:hypothetical protein